MPAAYDLCFYYQRITVLRLYFNAAAAFADGLNPEIIHRIRIEVSILIYVWLLISSDVIRLLIEAWSK